MTIADRIKEVREKRGLSQEELAKKMGLKSRSSITRIEKSGDDVSMRDIERIAEVLNCSKLYLFGYNDNDFVLNDEEMLYILDIRSLNTSQKDRLFAYMKALKDMNESK